MHIPENATVLYPESVEEALIASAQNKGSICLYSLTEFPEIKLNPAEIQTVINISGIDELNFFMEDHAGWFIGTALNIDELSAIALERIPELGQLLLQHNALDEETLQQFLKKKKARIHLAGKNGMNIFDLNIDEKEIGYHLLGYYGIPCMLSIPKQALSP